MRGPSRVGEERLASDAWNSFRVLCPSAPIVVFVYLLEASKSRARNENLIVPTGCCFCIGAPKETIFLGWQNFCEWRSRLFVSQIGSAIWWKRVREFLLVMWHLTILCDLGVLIQKARTADMCANDFDRVTRCHFFCVLRYCLPAWRPHWVQIRKSWEITHLVCQKYSHEILEGGAWLSPFEISWAKKYRSCTKILWLISPLSISFAGGPISRRDRIEKLCSENMKAVA